MICAINNIKTQIIIKLLYCLTAQNITLLKIFHSHTLQSSTAFEITDVGSTGSQGPESIFLIYLFLSM